MQIIRIERPREDAGLRDGVIIKTCAKVVRQNESRSDVKVALHNFYDVMQKREYKKKSAIYPLSSRTVLFTMFKVIFRHAIELSSKYFFVNYGNS